MGGWVGWVGGWVGGWVDKGDKDVAERGSAGEAQQAEEEPGAGDTRTAAGTACRDRQRASHPHDPSAPPLAHLHSLPPSPHLHSCQHVPWSSGRGAARRVPARQVVLVSGTEQSPPAHSAVHSHTPSELQLCVWGVGGGPAGQLWWDNQGGTRGSLQQHSRRRPATEPQPSVANPLPASRAHAAHAPWGPSRQVLTCRGRCSCAGSARF